MIKRMIRGRGGGASARVRSTHQYRYNKCKTLYISGSTPENRLTIVILMEAPFAAPHASFPAFLSSLFRTTACVQYKYNTRIVRFPQSACMRISLFSQSDFRYMYQSLRVHNSQTQLQAAMQNVYVYISNQLYI